MGTFVMVHAPDPNVGLKNCVFKTPVTGDGDKEPH